MVASSKLPEGVTSYKDRHGKRRYRYRDKGFQRALPSPDEESFKAAYAQAILDSKRKVTPYAAFSLSWLICQYKMHDKGWQEIGQKTRRDKSALLVRMEKPWGQYDIRTLTSGRLTEIMSDVKARSTYNRILGLWRALLGFAVKREWIDDNVALNVDRVKWKAKKTHGWTREEIAQYRAYHKSGTKARLAFELMYCTIQGSADVVYMGPRTIHNGRIDSRRVKTKASYCAPITKALQVELDQLPPQFLFLMTHEGNGYSEAGFHGRMSAWIDQAGLPERCTPHGIRVAGCEELAESGVTAPEMMAISGHMTLSEAQGYIMNANKKSMSDSAARKRKLANLDNVRQID